MARPKRAAQGLATPTRVREPVMDQARRPLSVLATSLVGVTPPASGGTGTGTVQPVNRVIIAGAAGVYTSDPALVFDLTNKRLGVGISTPDKDIDLSHGGFGALPFDSGGARDSFAALRIGTPTAATSGVPVQASPALEFRAQLWDVDQAVNRTPRYGLYMGGGSANQTFGYLGLRHDEGAGSGYFLADDIRIGRVVSGDVCSVRMGDGNFVFNRSGSRGLLWTDNPLTDSTASNFQRFVGQPNGTIIVNTLPNFLYIEGNTIAGDEGSSGTPTMQIRHFDYNSTTPGTHIRFRSTSGISHGIGFGGRLLFQAHTPTVNNRDQGELAFVWADPTDATRSADFRITLTDNAAAIAEKFRVKSTGEILLIAAGLLTFTGRSKVSAPADGQVLLTDNAGTSFGRVQLGGTSSSFPAIKRASAVLEVRLADDSAYAELRALRAVVDAGERFGFAGRSRITSPADGQLLVTDDAAATFARLMLGGTSASFPAIKRNAAVVEVKLADDSDFAEVKAKILRISDGAFMIRSAAAMTDGAGASAGTLTNAPAAGNPTKWIPFDDNGTTRFIPAW